MIANERPSSPSLRPPDEETIRTATVLVEHKSFMLSLKENPKGRFLRISEKVGSRFNSIIIPATGLEEFQKVLGEMTREAGEIPAKLPQ